MRGVHALEPVHLHGLVFDVAGLSEQGPRSENQDAYAVDAFAGRGLLVVADGMGGQKAGRLAADTAVQAILQSGEVRSLDAARYALRAADEAVARSAREDPAAREHMGCAVAMMAATPDRSGQLGWVGANVGDVRILSRAPDGTVRLETRDHSQAFARWEAGEVALDEVADTPGANKLMRAIGHGGEADTVWIPLRPGWAYLLVSDGVTKAMRLDEVGAALALPGAAAACEAIRKKVEERGPDDNYTAVVVRVLDGRDPDVTHEHPRAAVAARPAPPAPRTGAAAVSAPPPPAAPNLFAPERAMAAAPRRTSPLAAAALVVSLLALGGAGYAAWRASEMDAALVPVQADLLRLRAGVDSLRNPPVPDTVPLAPGGDTAPAVPGVSNRPAAPAAGTTPVQTPR